MLSGYFPGGGKTSLAEGQNRGILAAVQRVRTIIALLMAVAWPLMASHCSLGNLPSLGFFACAEDRCCEPQPESDCQSDACAVFESGLYKSETIRLYVPAPPLVVLCLIETQLEISGPIAASRVVPDSAPPELARLWQFSHRTALPPRAPSFVS